MLWSRCRNLQRYRREAIACAVAFPGLYATVIHGQPSVFALLALAFALIALERRREFQAGLALGCLVFKPHWAVAAGVVFLVAREWKVVAGIGLSALLQLGAALLVVGPRLFLAYLTTLQSIGRLGDVLEPRPGYALKSFFSVFMSESAGGVRLLSRLPPSSSWSWPPGSGGRPRASTSAPPRSSSRWCS